MMCDECGLNPASIHVTTITGDERHERNICPMCMAKMHNKFLKIDFSSLSGILSGLLEAAKANIAEQNEPDVKCARCNMAYAAFKKTGLLGCAECYQAFREPLATLLNRVHGRAQHVGRVPKGAETHIAIKHNVDRLRQELSKAISEEEYETAAGLRDQIRALNARLANQAAKEEP
jgi:protein arginine kinase activator